MCLYLACAASEALVSLAHQEPPVRETQTTYCSNEASAAHLKQLPAREEMWRFERREGGRWHTRSDSYLVLITPSIQKLNVVFLIS